VPNKINLITPPDNLHNNNFSISLINLNEKEKETVSIFLSRQNDDREINLYAYANDNNPVWLLNSVRWQDCPVYINLDNSSDISVKYISYMLSKSNVFYSTMDANTKETYSLINVNHIKDINDFLDKVYNEQ
jgi:hypothetical protein